MEALIVWQLDKIECAAQAVRYAQQGHRLDPEEFIISAEKAVTHSLLVDMLALIREEHETSRYLVRHRSLWERIVAAWKALTA